jgi:hypothetical protein
MINGFQGQDNSPFSLITGRNVYNTIIPLKISPFINNTIIMEKHHRKVAREKLKN